MYMYITLHVHLCTTSYARNGINFGSGPPTNLRDVFEEHDVYSDANAPSGAHLLTGRAPVPPPILQAAGRGARALALFKRQNGVDGWRSMTGK